MEAMDARVTRLEDDRRDVRSELKPIRDLLTELRFELANKPSAGSLWGMNGTVFGVGLHIRPDLRIADWASRPG